MANLQLQAHIPHIMNRKPGSLSKVLPGDIIQFTYNAKIQNPTDQNPLVMVINPNYMGELHSVNLNYLNRIQVQQMVKSIGIRTIHPSKRALKEAYKKGVPLVRVKVRRSKSFYTGVIKPLLTSLVKRPSAAYRTYAISRVGSVTLIDYNFDLEDKILRAGAALE